ncbi:MAG: MerR family transcriptional regulator [Gammaproteobacteria bacterium]|nr:MerR family transcriptional regulator [Gammaproteobacteria bacterium]
MRDPAVNHELPPIPAKKYFTIGEVSDLCEVKPHVLRYWEQEFPKLQGVKRRGNRRYYQRHDVQLIREIRSLLYIEGFTISGARNRLSQRPAPAADMAAAAEPPSLSSERDILEMLAEALEEVRRLLSC